MEIILYINKHGTKVDECDFRAIDICEGDEKTLLEIVKRSLENNYVFNRVFVLSKYEYDELSKFKSTHPDYIEYKEAQEIVNKFEEKYKF